MNSRARRPAARVAAREAYRCLDARRLLEERAAHAREDERARRTLCGEADTAEPGAE
jgi:hypothetical protein